SSAACRTRTRGPGRPPPGEFEHWHLARAASPPPSGLNPADAEVLSHMADPRVKRALHQLPDIYRTTVYLADVEGYTYREIACLMRTPVGTVMSRLHRGRRQLRDLLQDYAGAHRPARTALAGPARRGRGPPGRAGVCRTGDDSPGGGIARGRPAGHGDGGGAPGRAGLATPARGRRAGHDRRWLRRLCLGAPGDSRRPTCCL